MLRVLQVIHSMNLGGAENLIMNIYRNLDRNDIQFDFLVNAKGKFDIEIIQMGGKIWEIPYVNKVGPLKYKKELLEFFKEHSEYQVVHSHLDKVSGIVVECAKKAGVRKCITHSHSTNTTGNFLVRGLKNYYQRKINKNADVKLACSQQAGIWLYGNDENFTVINNGIELKKFQFQEVERKILREEYGINKEDIVFGHVGRFSAVKNHVFLIRLFKRLSVKYKNSYLLLCGGGELQAEIEEQIKQSGLKERVIILEARTDVHRIYNMIDIFVFPSLYEGISLAMIEAQANGLPVVASNTIDPQSAQTDGVLFVSLDDENSVWEEAIEIALCRGRKEQTKQIAKAGFDISNTIAQVVRYYEEVTF